MRSPFAQLVGRLLVLALGVLLATRLVAGIECHGGTTLLVVVLLLSFFHAVLKPVLVLFTLPFILGTMGLGVVVINALLFLMVGHLVNGFSVAGFWSALLGSLIVSLTNLALSAFTRAGRRPEFPPAAQKPKTGNVIDG